MSANPSPPPRVAVLSPGLSGRPRAGTMPSTFTLGAGSDGAGSSSRLSVPFGAQGRFDMSQRHLSHLNPAYPASGSLSMPVSGGTTPNPEVEPNAYFPSSSASPHIPHGGPKPSASVSDLAALRARARAGTVGIPISDSSSFGKGVFPSTFSPWESSNMAAPPRRSEESGLSGDENPDGAEHVRDLISHLGLDTDSPISPPSKHATLPAHPQSVQMESFRSHNGLRPAGTNELASNLNAMAGRLRASTVSGMMPPQMPPMIRRNSPLKPGAAGEQHDGLEGGEGSPFGLTRGRGGLPLEGGTGSDGRLLYSSSSGSASRAPSADHSPERLLNHNLAAVLARPRASTMAGAGLLAGSSPRGLPSGALDSLNAAATARARAGTLASMTSHPNLLALSGPQNNGNGSLPPSFSTPERNTLNANALGFVPTSVEQQAAHSVAHSRPRTPEGHRPMGGSSPPPQQPSRSLWIGALDPRTTAQELMAAFSCYGHIESLRLLPEKECGFVNYMSVHDALRARDDILVRLGGQIMLRNGPTHVRIGFGKPESAPATPASAIHNGRGPPMQMTPANGDSSLQTSPTRALWIGSIPAQTTPNHLLEIFSTFGPVESARVLTHKNCGFVNFEHLDDAVKARKALNGREILGSEVGAVKIGFAKVPVKAPGTFAPSAPHDPINSSPAHQIAAYEALGQMRGASAIPLDQQLLSGGMQDYRSNLAMSFVPNGVHSFSGFHPPPPDFGGFPPAPMPSITEMQLLMRELSGDDPNARSDEETVAEFRPPTMYYTSIPPPINQEDPQRRFGQLDAPRLRDLRKRIDTGLMEIEQLDQIATEIIEDIVYLSSDYIGNTLVQKLFEKCSPHIRIMMLERVAPHLAIIGCHKNGTWAAQKIIDCATSPEEIKLVTQNLKPFSPPLLLDPLGNYVMQCTLRFGLPANDFVYDAMVDRCWEISQGRFGARSMRTCLESEHATPAQVKRVAISIILNSIPLATNPNGALLLTWLLDSSTLPGRYRLLAPRLAPHLSHLCTHKLASLTVLRIVNQNVDPDASKAIIDALFFSSRQVLEEVLGDQVHGITVIQKVLASPFVEPSTRPTLMEKTKEVLLYLRVQTVPAYRRLAEELGIPVSGPSHAALLARTPPRPNQQHLPGWGTPPPSHLGFNSYDQHYRAFSSPMGGMPMTPNMGMGMAPMMPQGMGMMSPPPRSPQGHPMPAPIPVAFGPGSPLHRQMSPLPPGSPISHPMSVGSPDPFTALRYHQAFNFGPGMIGAMVGGGSPVPMSPPPPMHEYHLAPHVSGGPALPTPLSP